ncbi:MAG: leucyl aminopeptidase family protein, partial [Myxococcota bacterium]
MLDHLVARSNAKTVPIVPIDPTGLKTWLAEGDRMAKNWISAAGFTGKPGQVCTVPGADGQPDRVLLGAPKPDTGEMWAWAALAGRLPVGRYRIDGELDKERADAAALGWALGCYEFTRYRKPRKKRGQLVWPAGADRARVTRLAEGIALTRDLITTPAGDMGPAELADAAKALAKRHRGKCATIVGKALLDRDYPAVHAV